MKHLLLLASILLAAFSANARSLSCSITLDHPGEGAMSGECGTIIKMS